jgi:hypothetical protein
MEDLDVDVVESEWLEDQILTLFEGKRDFIIMSALTMVTAKVIVNQKLNATSLDVKRVLDMADEQLRFTVNGVLEMMRRNRDENRN